jgi:hypothetical protein
VDFLVEFDARVPDGAPETEVEERVRAEASAAAKLAPFAGASAMLPAARDPAAGARRAAQLLEALGCHGALPEVEEWIAARDARVPQSRDA